MSDRPEEQSVSREEFERLRQDFAALQDQFEAAGEVRIGLTAVGDSPAEADKRYREAERILLEEARASLQEVPLPV